ncbi:hypothetical protein LINPERPRIM_LOCUS24474 [Linum perenne]
MGNCLQGSKLKSQVHQEQDPEELVDRVKDSCNYNEKEEEEEKSPSVNGVKVKIVLTKEELEWLMFELNGGSTTKLEDALAEIQRNRASLKPVNFVLDDDEDDDSSDDDDDDGCWRPSLESITEVPEEEGFEESER